MMLKIINSEEFSVFYWSWSQSPIISPANIGSNLDFMNVIKMC